MSHIWGGGITSKPRTFWNADVPPYVKEYFQQKGLSARKVIVSYYKICKSQELPEKLKELKVAQERVSRLQAEVTQLQAGCDTEWDVCNTLFELFKSQGRDINNISRQDRFWIERQFELKKITSKTVEEFIEHYKKEVV